MAAHLQDPTPLARRWDAIVLGGGHAAAACALHLVRTAPGCRVLVLSPKAAVREEAMLAVRGAGAAFLLQDLALEEDHELWTLPHHGARHWWAGGAEARLESMFECGESSPPHEPAFHVDAKALTAHLTLRAQGLGARFYSHESRCALELGLPLSRVSFQLEGDLVELQAAWLIDTRGFLERPEQDCGLRLHVASARWSGLRAWSHFHELASRPGLRSLAEHHFHGPGWRAQLSPAPGGRHWLQVVLDPSCCAELNLAHDGLHSLQDYGRFVRTRPGLRELLRGAEVEAESFSAESLEAAYVSPACGRGWVCIGEAAGRLAPFDGEPLAQLAAGSRAAVELVTHGLPTRPASRADEHGAALAAGFRERAARWGEQALMLGGDPTLMCAATSLDLGFRLAPIQSHASELLRGWVRARLVRLAGELAERGLYGQQAPGQGRSTRSSAPQQLLRGLGAWLRLEARSLRENFTPVQGDEYVSATVTLQQYAASRQNR